MKVGRLGALSALLGGCATAPVDTPVHLPPVTLVVPADETNAGMAPDLGVRLDSIVSAGIAQGAAPGVAVAVGRWGKIVHLRGYGRIDHAPNAPAITDSTLFDMASLTKVIATTTAAMILEDEGRLDLDAPIRTYLPELDAREKAGITTRMLLTHTGGFEAFAALWRDTRGRAAYIRQINTRPLAYAPGDSTVYSDWDFVLAGLVIERIAGQPLDQFLSSRVWQPMRMRDTGYNPLLAGTIPADSSCTATFRADHPLLARIARTEMDTVYRRTHVHGIVHDENACALGGVAGHAGLFSSARDLAAFGQMLLSNGRHGDVRLIQAPTVARWTARQSRRSSRAIGWDTPTPRSSAGRYFAPRSFGHTGFTGTSIWVDPERGLFVVILTNRVNPTRGNMRHEALRRDVADAVQAAVTDAPLVEWGNRR
ncbi:MAG TPA: serine hydrolase domain-containing protein [Gemmatimonadaceae bacterium]|nr:serine hydrolase domain-containing protein [Gemmatimonadaceae bacterium]